MKLIKVNVLKEWIENWFTKNRAYHPYAKNNNIPITELYDILERLPSAQPEVIRCKECEWFRKEYGWNCIEYTVCGVSPTHHPIRREDDFCSHAERRNDE